MRRQMRDMDRMMEAMMEPFGMMDPFFGGSRQRYGQNMLEDGQPRRQVSRRQDQHDMDMMMPFGGGGLFGGGLFGNVSNLMQQMVGDPETPKTF